MDKNIAIEFNGVGKQYRLGLVGTGSLQHDLNRWWQTTIMRREDPYLKIGEVNDRSVKGHSDYVWALKDISFKVEQGDVVGIIGKNGAGKSTLLKLLSHITAPTVGDIRYRGRIASLLEVGTGFHPEMTARQNIYMNGSIMGMTKHEIDRKLDEIVDFAGIERYLDTPVKRFSSGMTVRLGFAVAAFLEPEILVVDEVLAVGDAEFQKKAIGKMQDVSSSGGRTVLFVSHNMAAVRNLCKHSIVLQNGQIQFLGETDKSIEYYIKSCLSEGSDLPVSEQPREGKGSGKVRVTNVEFRDFNGNIYSPRCGKFLRVDITLKVQDEGIKSGRLDFSFRDIMGNDLTNFSTNMKLEEFPLSGGEHHIYCDIQKLPLTAGQYRFGIYVKADGECADWIGLAKSIEVQDDAFYGTPWNIAGHLAGKIVLVDHNWEIK